MKPDQHGPLSTIGSRRPDVQVQAILALLAWRQSVAQWAALTQHSLWRDHPILRCIAHSRPCLRRLWRAKTQFSNRRLRKWNALPHADRPLIAPAYLATGRLYNCLVHSLMFS